MARAALHPRAPSDHIDATDQGKGCEAELLGALFVAWLRADNGFRSAVQRMDRACRASGQGKSHASAFQGQFGMSLEDAGTQSASFLDQTQSDGKSRLAGTLWAPFL